MCLRAYACGIRRVYVMIRDVRPNVSMFGAAICDTPRVWRAYA